MRPVLLVRNDTFETFGVAPAALTWAGMDLLSVNMTDPGARLPALKDVAGVVTFGGTVNVDQVHEHPYLATVRDYTLEAVERGVPYLGICLGSQILARALGEQVAPSPVREVGFEPISPTPEAKADPILSFLADGERVLQWHEDTHALPEGAVLLATAERVPLQAYRVGDRAWGVQFHLEVDATEFGWWLEVAETRVDLERVWGKPAELLRREAAEHMAAQEERGREIFRRFAEIASSA